MHLIVIPNVMVSLFLSRLCSYVNSHDSGRGLQRVFDRTKDRRGSGLPVTVGDSFVSLKVLFRECCAIDPQATFLSESSSLYLVEI